MTEEKSREPVDDLTFYTLVRSRLDHEDNLIVNRLSWLVASQAFLFTAYAITLNGLVSGTNLALSDRQAMLCRVIPLVGLATTGLIYVSILAAIRSMGGLRRAFHARVSDAARVGLPPITSPEAVRLFGMAAPLCLPVVFVAVWLGLFIAGLG